MSEHEEKAPLPTMGGERNGDGVHPHLHDVVGEKPNVARYEHGASERRPDFKAAGLDGFESK